MQRIKSFFSIFIIFCFILPLTACSKEPVKIGLMVDLTGRASEIGISGRNGAEIAVEEINQNGGNNNRKISLIIKDDKGLPVEAEKVDKELISEGITLGIGHFASGTGIAGLKVFNNAGKLMISPTMSSESLTNIDDCFIRIIDSNKKQGEVLAEAAINQNKDRKLAILYEKNNIPYTVEVCRYFKELFEKSGGQIVMEESFVSSPSIDFDNIVDRISDSNADGVLIVAGGLDVAVITQKIKLKKTDINIYSGMWAMTGDLIKNGGKSIEGLFLPGVYNKKSNIRDFTSFRNKYLKKYSEEPTFASMYSYESIYMVFSALKKCGNKYDTVSIKNNILKLKTFKGLNGNFGVNSFGDTDRGYYLFQVKNAEFIRVK